VSLNRNKGKVMRVTIVLCAMLGMCMAADEWTEFKRVYGKAYQAGEEELRKSIFLANVKLVAEHNVEFDLGLFSYRMGISALSDLTTEEKTGMQGLRGAGGQTFLGDKDFSEVAEADLPSSVDWRKKGVVAPVKNQGTCGSCWAFSTVGSLEGVHAIKTGKLVEFSEQNLVDCSWPEGAHGCGGGYQWFAWQEIINSHGIDTEASYPYIDNDEKCKFNKNTIGATIRSYVNITSGDELALQKAVATVGPIAVGVDATWPGFWSYKSGVYYEPQCGNQLYDLSHGVVVVGYGSENGKDYWPVRNSYGVVYGDKGYLKMSRNRGNNCGIATAATYPIL